MRFIKLARSAGRAFIFVNCEIKNQTTNSEKSIEKIIIGTSRTDTCIRRHLLPTIPVNRVFFSIASVAVEIRRFSSFGNSSSNYHIYI